MTKSVHYGPHSFHALAPWIWNMLPPHLKDINIHSFIHIRVRQVDNRNYTMIKSINTVMSSKSDQKNRLFVLIIIHR